jgi:hypothetical protein
MDTNSAFGAAPTLHPFHKLLTASRLLMLDGYTVKRRRKPLKWAGPHPTWFLLTWDINKNLAKEELALAKKSTGHDALDAILTAVLKVGMERGAALRQQEVDYWRHQAQNALSVLNSTVSQAPAPVTCDLRIASTSRRSWWTAIRSTIAPTRWLRAWSKTANGLLLKFGW